MGVVVLALCFHSMALHAQEASSIPGWYPLPDSLYLIWQLDQDQVRRLKVIEEDHEVERSAIAADPTIPPQERMRQLEQLASVRRKEVKAVLQLKQFEDWERRFSPSGR